MAGNKREDILAAAQLPVGAGLSVLTYRESDAKGAEARAFYKDIGLPRLRS